MSDSEYYKWRTLIAMAHIDKRLMKEEQQFLRKKIEELAPPAMHFQLFQDMTEDVLSPKPADMLFDRISEPGDKVEALILSHELFWADGNLDEAEEDIFRFMTKSVKSGETSHAILQEKMAGWSDDDEEKKSLKALIERV